MIPSQELINDRDVPAYLTHVERRLREENERLLHYLDTSSKWQLIHTVEKQLISEHLASILTKGLDSLLEENRWNLFFQQKVRALQLILVNIFRKSELRLMYSLLGRVKSGHIELRSKVCPKLYEIFLTALDSKILLPQICEYVKKRGSVIVINPEKDKTMVQELLEFKEKERIILPLHVLKDSLSLM